MTPVTQFDLGIFQTAKVLNFLISGKESCSNQYVVGTLSDLESATEHLKKLQKILISIKKAILDEPLGVYPSQELLQEFDPKYFDCNVKKWDEETAFYRLATWLFDNSSEMEKSLKKLKSFFDSPIVEKVKHYYDEERHDT